MTVQTANSLRITRTHAATPEEAFDAWSQPEHMKNWACPESATLEDVQVDLRVGGSYRLRMKGAEGESYTAFGTYREIDRPNQVVYTWDWEEADHAMGETLVTATFERNGDSTELTLVHEGFPVEEAKAAHEEGWTSCLSRYQALLG